MNALAIVAGIPLDTYRRHRGRKLQVPGWDIEVIPSHRRGPGPELSSVWKKVLQAADGASAEGVHLLLSHSGIGQDRRRFNAEAYPRHRVAWIEPAQVTDYGADSFAIVVTELLNFESAWRDEIRPSGASSPLLLPETCFDAATDVRKMWERAAKVGVATDSLEAVGKVVARFRSTHHVSAAWCDLADRQFSHGVDHAFHTPAERRFKYSFQLPLGFHYDVRHSANRPFRLTDCTGTVRQFNKYTNVDPHGHIRGGA